MFIVPAGTLRLPSPRFFRAFSSVVRQMPGYNPQRRGTARTLPKSLCCPIHCSFCVVLCTVCVQMCVLYNCHRVANQLQLKKYIDIIIKVVLDGKLVYILLIIENTTIDGRIAYTNRKYHSVWISIDVTSWFAGVKLSGSLRMYSSFRVNVSSTIMISNPKLSFTASFENLE